LRNVRLSCHRPQNDQWRLPNRFLPFATLSDCSSLPRLVYTLP
jgi:hypothetical protein